MIVEQDQKTKLSMQYKDLQHGINRRRGKEESKF
jgi:hypothetical protein